jgi:hypothetical protein
MVFSGTGLLLWFVDSARGGNLSSQIISPVDQTTINHHLLFNGIPIDLLAVVLFGMFIITYYDYSKDKMTTLIMSTSLFIILPILVAIFDPTEFDAQLIGYLYQTPFEHIITNRFAFLICTIILVILIPFKIADAYFKMVKNS